MNSLRVQFGTVRRWFCGVGAVGFVAITPSHAWSQRGDGASPIPQVVAVATGEATVVPDRGLVTFAVESRSPTAAAAGAANARVQTAVIAALRAKGVQSEHISTSGYSVSPNERYDAGERRVVGYIARNSVVVDLQRIEQVGALIDAALGAGANRVGGLRYYSSTFESIRREALERAVEKAKADAEVMARAAGGTLGTPLEISASDDGGPRPMYEVADVRIMAAAAEQAPETPVSVGEQKVTVRVSTRWIFLPGR